MATRKQIAAAKRNIKKAQAANRRRHRGKRLRRRKYHDVRDYGGRIGLRRKRRR